MITLVLAISAGTGAFLLAYFPGSLGTGWSVFLGLLALFSVQGGLSFYFMKRMKCDMEAVQALLLEGKRAVDAKMARWQFRPPGSIQDAQKIIEADMKEAVRKAIEATARLERYKWWVMLAEKQVATARFHLNWMVKNFDEIDRLMPKALFLDGASCAMKMARLYMKGVPSDEIVKVYRKAILRAKYNENVIPAACMSWIHLKRGEDDAAFKVLCEALKKSDNAVLKANHEHLMNNRRGHFSNTNLGDQWFALHLEEPKIRQQRRMNVR